MTKPKKKGGKLRGQKPKNKRPGGSKAASRGDDQGQPRCGLCGKTGNLTKTECCGNWICDDEDQYVLFSYARNSCYRNHSRYTLCGFHHVEGHEGRWQDCDRCREDIAPELYAYYGTNEYNFEVLENPPSFEPTRCAQCGRVIRRAYEPHSKGPQGCLCQECCDFL